MVILGADVGISGALAAIGLGQMGGLNLIDCIGLPVIRDGTNKQLNIQAIGAWLELVSPDIAFIENVTPMPSLQGNRSMGATSAFRFGMACGCLRGVLGAYSIKTVLVTPQSWKRALGFARGSDKEASRQMALDRFPCAASKLKFKNSHNLAESILIALYGANQKVEL
jgi:hypothetical protein